MVQLNVPLLTIVPIPYIAIQSVDINFKANISASSSSVTENSSSQNLEAGGTAKAKLNLGIFKVEANLKANYSSKKDSKATEESKYSVESTIDVAVKAGQDSMPAGLAKVLELLGNSLDVVDAKGELTASATELPGGSKLVVTYKNREGIFDPKAITIDPKIENSKIDGDSFVVDKLPNPEKDKTTEYTFKAGENSVTVVVKHNPEDKPQA